MDPVGVNVIETASLGRPFQLGMLYDCRKDALIPGIRLWNKEQLQQNIYTCPQINTAFNVTASDSFQDKSKLLNIDGGLKLSFLGDLIHVSGAAKYLKDTKTSFKQQRLTLHYHSTSRFEELITSHLSSGRIAADDNDIGTHVVTAILYGADACFVFDREVSSDEDTKTVKGEVKVALDKLHGIVSLGANAEISVNENQKTAVKSFKCTFYGDFQLPSNPTTFEDALKVFADLPKLLKDNQELAVPLRVWLYPLDKLQSRASKLQKDISMDLMLETESVIESLYTAEIKCSDLLEDSPALTFAAFRDKILQMKHNCYNYKLRLVKKLGSLLPNIRGDVMKKTDLTDLLQEHDASPYRGRDIAEWLKEREMESEIIKSVLRQLKDYGAQVEDNIDAVLMDLEVGNLVSYMFTSLDCSDVLLLQQTSYLSPSTQEEANEKSPDSKQKSWLTPEIQKTMRRNLEIFKNLIDSKDRKAARFIVSSKEMVNNPGSCILLYEHGCEEAVCFTPPSKPVCPVTEEVKGQSVVLKVVPPSCPATVELRLLYKEKQDLVWRSEAVLKDQHTVTLTDLRSGAEYEIKCAALGKLNYTRESDVITVTAQQNNNKPAVMSPEGDVQDCLRIVLIGMSGHGKSATGNTILGREEFENNFGPHSVTTACEKRIGEVDGRSVAVVDTPGLFHTSLSNEQVAEEIMKCVSLSSPGPHVFVIVLRSDIFTRAQMSTIDLIKKIFGPKAAQFTIVLFTGGDRFHNNWSIEDYVRQQSSELKKLIRDCGNRFLAFNNTEKQDKTQVTQLLKMIEELKNSSEGPYFTNSMFEEAEILLWTKLKVL